jgi:SAM-dependent methyltransferase
MVHTKNPEISGRDYYQSLYQSDLEFEAQWLTYGASQKTDSIEMLLRRNRIQARSILELGCGTGAVILECQRRGLAEEFLAIDYSGEAISYLKSHSTGIECLVADITDQTFTLDRRFDVVVLSHVLEHLEDPLQFLKSVMNRIGFRYLICEVPLEDLWASRIKNLFRDRTRSAAGHVQFFTGTSFKKLLGSAALRLADKRRYVSVVRPDVIDFVARKEGRSNLGILVKKVTWWYLPRTLGPIWSQFYMANCAVLCEPARNVGTEAG